MCIAVILAAVSSLYSRPQLAYIDFDVLAILLSLMLVVAELKEIRFLDWLAVELLNKCRSKRQLELVLLAVTYVSSMFVTNDVALLTFVPLALIIGKTLKMDMERIIILQTLAANLGSMLTPLGNPQNLYLYGKSGMAMSSFVLLMLPYSIISLVLIAIWAVWLCREGSDIIVTHSAVNSEPDKKLIALYGILFVACLLVVLRVLPYGVAFVAILVCTFFADRPALGRVDYSLILTFVALFIFIGNLGRIEAFSGWLQNILAGHEVLVSVLASQVTSNVPAAILLSGFTDNFCALIIGTNLGGLGTLIASMASLISYRQIANEVPAEKGHYFAMFTISNVVFLAILMGAWALT